MLDWEITEQDSLNTPEDETSPPPRPSRRGFYLILGAILIVGISITALFSWRFQERDNALEADLLGQIRAEEAARLVGNQDRVPDLIAPDLPRAWRDRYLNQFRIPDGESHPVEVSIEKVEYQGVQAQVWVRLGNQVQRRAYEQRAQGWRRVPLPINDETFGGVSYWREQGVEIYKQASDTDFAEEVANDMSALWESVGAWDGSPRSTKLPNFVEIRPEELRPALLEVRTEAPPRIVVNSPQVVALPATMNLRGDSAVRLAVAQGMWEQLPNARLSTVQLPGGNRFVNALQAVLALQWALTPEEYSTLTTQWHEQAKSTEWQSPFFALTTAGGNVDPFNPRNQAVALLVVADGLVSTIGTDPATLATLRPALENATSWDDFFGTVANQSTLAFEATVRGVALPENLSPAFTATLAPPSREGASARGFAVTVAGHPSPIVIEALQGGAEIGLPDGTTFNAACASLFGELEIEGRWLDAGLRLEPTSIKANHPVPPTTFTNLAPPATTIAYIAEYADSSNNELRQISAMTPDGQLTPVLIPETPGRSLMYSGGWGVTDSNTGVMLSSEGMPSSCDAQWLMRYVPGRGITGAWLARRENITTYLLPRWADQGGRGMVVRMNTGNLNDEAQMPFWWLVEGAPTVLGEPDGYLPGGSGYLLNPSAESVLVYQVARPDTGRAAVTLVELATLTERAVYSPPTPDYYGIDFAYSGDGTSLYLAWQVPGISEGVAEGTVLEQVDLTTGTTTEWWSPDQGSLFFVVPDIQAPYLYTMMVSATEPTQARLVRLSATEILPLNDSVTPFGISMIRRCTQGGLLYMRVDTPLEQETRFELDPRFLHIITPDEMGREPGEGFPLTNTQIPILCP